jgi:hypothetical protein
MMRRTPMKRTGWTRKLGPRVSPALASEKKEPLSHMEFAQAAINSIVNGNSVEVGEATRDALIGGTGWLQVNRGAITRINPQDTIQPIPKADPQRNPALLALAKGRRCLLRVPGVCQGGTETTVAAHSNWACHGKGMGKKASDAYTVWGCAACHIGWLDQGPAPKEVKQATFMRAHVDQVLEWRRIAQDPTERPRDRKAALWALEKLNSSLAHTE